MDRQTDFEKFAAIIAALAATFRVEADKPLFAGYWLGLHDLPLAAVERGCAAAIRRSRFMPTVAEIRALAGVPTERDRAEQAADIAWEAVSLVGCYRSPDFQDRTINAAIRSLGGWERCCELSVEQWQKFERRRFVEAYERIARTGASEDALRSLTGYHARANSGSGLVGPTDGAVLVGCDYLEQRQIEAR